MEVATESTRNINSDLNFITSNKGQPLLIMNQYIYICNKKRPNKKCWVRMVKDCGVNVHTDIYQNYLSGGKTDGGHPKNHESLSFLNTTFFMNPYSVFDIFCRHFYRRHFYCRHFYFFVLSTFYCRHFYCRHFYCRPKFRDS